MAPGQLPATCDLDPVDQHVLDPLGLGVEAAGSAGEVVAGVLGAVADPLGVQHHQVGAPPDVHPAPVPQAVEPGRHLGELADGRLPAEQPRLRTPSPSMEVE